MKTRDLRQRTVTTSERKSDGHTYIFSHALNEWIAFPTFMTGDPDWLNPIPVSDINLSEDELEKLYEWLRKRKK